MNVKVKSEDCLYKLNIEVFDKDYVENLVTDNHLLQETLNYILQNMLTENEIVKIKELCGERNIQKFLDGSYAWISRGHATY